MKVEHRDWDLFLKIAEYPFKRPDMTPEEFEEELMFSGEHYEEYKNGTYKPLWQQRKE